MTGHYCWCNLYTLYQLSYSLYYGLPQIGAISGNDGKVSSVETVLQSEKSKGLRTKVEMICRNIQIGQSGLEGV